VGVASNVGDPTRILFYKGARLVAGSEECALLAGSTPVAEVSSFEEAVTFQAIPHEAGAPLVALAEGLGLRRSHPDLRRFQGLGQLVVDPCDPAVVARHLLAEPMTYPGTGATTGVHALVIPTMGDMNVPVSSGITFARAAGLVGFLDDDPR
jgi:hypothetical protein